MILWATIDPSLSLALSSEFQLSKGAIAYEKTVTA
jgi:hypothetical protein